MKEFFTELVNATPYLYLNIMFEDLDPAHIGSRVKLDELADYKVESKKRTYFEVKEFAKDQWVDMEKILKECNYIVEFKVVLPFEAMLESLYNNAFPFFAIMTAVQADTRERWL